MDNLNVLKDSNYKLYFGNRSILIKPITDLEVNEKYISWLNDKDLNKYLEVRHSTQDKNSIIEYINSLRNRQKCDLFAIFNKENKIHLGNLSITSFDKNGDGSIEFGLMIGDEKSRLSGVGAEIHLIFLEFCFSFNEIHRVECSAASENQLACKTLESIGYVREGARRNKFPLRNSRHCDLVYYGILREEWNIRKKKLSKIIEKLEFFLFDK